MIEIGNKRWRNLQEQVAWLTAMIGQATDVVKNIYGTVADAASLPSASTFSNGTTFAVGSAAPFEYYVAINGVWLDIGTFPLEGPAGTDGEDGNSIFITSQATTSGTTAIPAATIYNPDSLTIHAGDMIFSEEGNVFAVTGVNSMPGYNVVYRCSIKGPTGATGPTGQPGQPGQPGHPGQPGEDGATWKAGSAVIHVDGSGGAFVIPVSSYTGAKVGDFYLSTTTYTSDGYTISKGDVWTITAMTGDGTYGVLSKVTNIEGPQGGQGDPGSPGSPGAPGQDGAQIILSSATTTSATTTIDSSTMTAELHPPAIGDVVISATGDVFIITGEGAGTLFTVQYGLSIGGSGSVAWGQITGAIADQTDLVNALGQYLPLTGGTMTGQLSLGSASSISLNQRKIVSGFGQFSTLENNGTQIVFGSTSLPTIINSSVTIKHGSDNILDAANTAANVTLAGTEADLTSLKLNGTTYKVPSGGGSIYDHNIIIADGDVPGGIIGTYQISFHIFNNSATPLSSFNDIYNVISGKAIVASGIMKDGTNVEIVFELQAIFNNFYRRSVDLSYTAINTAMINKTNMRVIDNIFQLS